MAVTISVQELVQALRLGASPEELAIATRLLAYSTEAVLKHAPEAPDAVHDEAAIRLSGFFTIRPWSALAMRYVFLEPQVSCCHTESTELADD